MRERGPSTTAVHAAPPFRLGPRGVATPIVQSATFDLDDEAYADIAATGGANTIWYTRLGNPTVHAVAGRIAALERTGGALLFSSGMAAISATLLALAGPGQRIVAARDLYGDAHTVLTRQLPELGYETVLVPLDDLDGFERELGRGAAMLYVESLSNPMLRVPDLPFLAQLARATGAVSVIDSTFATPVNVRPAEHGFDVVLHSATKYLNGHSDLVAGALAASGEPLERIRARAITLGGCLDPHAAFLLERGLKTLALRMERHNANGLAVARALESHPEIEAVCYPFLDSHPDAELARRLLRGGSGLVTIRVRGGNERAVRFLGALELIRQASSLGGVESLASAPHLSSHLALTEEERAAIGILPGTVRLSLGIEDADDLLADLDQALARSA